MAKRHRASPANQAVWDRAHRPETCKLALHPALAKCVADKLQQQWSPRQKAGWLMRTFPDDATCQVSNETTYRTLFIQLRGAVKKELLEHLRRTRAMRRSRHHTQKTADHGRICDTLSIRERPAAVEDRAVPGRWGGDLLFDSGNSRIAALVERSMRCVMRAKVDRKDTETRVDALIEHARQLPNQLYESLSRDRGEELVDHRRFTLATNIQVYLCDPRSPCQRGSRENTNGVLRQYFPKGIDVSGFTQAQLDEVARRLNERPRKTLDFEAPIERYRQLLRWPVETAVQSGPVAMSPDATPVAPGISASKRG